MIEITNFNKLGRFHNDWLNAHYHFSFADYRDPQREGFGPLRVWNDDEIRPGTGFEPHRHRDMEIITYVREGAISHRDDLGNRGRAKAGDVQVISAGTGIVHAEYNMEDVDAGIFQIWLNPTEQGLEPGWATAAFPKGDRTGQLVPLASGEPGVDALPIHQDVTLYGATLLAGDAIAHSLRLGRRAYLVAADGAFSVNGVPAVARDGILVANETELYIVATTDSEILFLDLPA